MNNRNRNCISALSNLVKNDYQYISKVLFSFITNKKFANLLNIFPYVLTMIDIINTEFSVEVWFTDQSPKTLELEENVNLTLLIG